MQFRSQGCRAKRYLISLGFFAWTACGPGAFPPASADLANISRDLDEPGDQMDGLIDPLRPGEVSEVALWGSDHRMDLFEPGIPADDADGVAVLFRGDYVQDLGDGRSRLFTSAFGSLFPNPLCPGELFGSQPAGRIQCTGFLVTPNTIATAAHCFVESYVQSIKVVFGFRMQDALTPQSFEIPNNQIYTGAAVIDRKYVINNPSDPHNGEDWMLFRLDRPVPDHRVLPVRRAGRIADGQEVYSIGYPSGLPAKFVGSARVYHNNRDTFFTTNLDAFGGSSGSPVFNATTHEVEGILTRTDLPDYVLQGGCYKAKLCTVDSCRGTEATRTPIFTHLIRPVERMMVALGTQHTCALSNSGRIKCWGANQCGQLGNNTRIPSRTPTLVTDDEVRDIEQIVAHRYHTCARRRDRAIFCWGSLGGPSESIWDTNPDVCLGASSSHPTAVLANAVDLVATPDGTCARLADGSAKCWRGGMEWTDRPALSDARWIDVPGGSIRGGQICTQRNGDAIRCGSEILDPALTESLRLSPYGDAWCGLAADGTTRCSEPGPSHGPTPPSQSLLDQLGDGIELLFNPPQEYCYLDLCDVGEICQRCEMIGSGMRSLVLLRDGSVRSGEIETWRTGLPPSYGLPPLVTALAGTKQLAVSNGVPVFGRLRFAPADVILHHACAVISDGVGKCWGDNRSGQLGNGTRDSTMTPVSVIW